MKTPASTYRQNQNRGKASSTSGFHRISRILLWIVSIVTVIILFILWTILKPILRGAGWLISAITALAILYWLLNM